MFYVFQFLICSLSFATFSVDKELPENRLLISFILLLTSVSFKSVVNNSLPRISYLTYMVSYCSLTHYVNTPVQYAANFKGCKNDEF